MLYGMLSMCIKMEMLNINLGIKITLILQNNRLKSGNLADVNWAEINKHYSSFGMHDV